MNAIDGVDEGWLIEAAELRLLIDKDTGSLRRLVINREGEFVWTNQQGDVYVRDDLAGKTFTRRDLSGCEISLLGNTLTIVKSFHHAEWVLRETYIAGDEGVEWFAQVDLLAGEYRSCEIGFLVPWPHPLYSMQMWAAKENMPTAPHRHAGISLEYGEVTSGICMPALCCYLKEENLGLLVTMPFDFKTPRFRFLAGYREPNLCISFDWLALAPGRSAKAKLLFRSCEGDWRPALGWLYEKYRGYFEPKSALLPSLWGGHTCTGHWDITEQEAKDAFALNMKWHEVHAHFPAYGNYHPENVDAWRSGHQRDRTELISKDEVQKTIDTLHSVGAAALLYMQLSGDGDETLLDPKFECDRIRNWHGELWSAWPGTVLMNSDPESGFGKDISRQIDGLVDRYPDADGVFVDQAHYAFLDTGHDDGMTAANNRPCYQTRLNFDDHLAHLSARLHPEKVIVANGIGNISHFQYVDAIMAESLAWLCDQYQYYTIGTKPIYFLEYDTDPAKVENMLQQSLLFGCCYTSLSSALPCKALYDAYLPLLDRMHRRKWVFEADPISVPVGFKGSIFRSERDSILIPVIRTRPRLQSARSDLATLVIRLKCAESIYELHMRCPGRDLIVMPFITKDGAVSFEIPPDVESGLFELLVR